MIFISNLKQKYFKNNLKGTVAVSNIAIIIPSLKFMVDGKSSL